MSLKIKRKKSHNQLAAISSVPDSPSLKSIDGVMKSSSSSSKKAIHHTARYASSHAPNASVALMRRGVKKPGPSLKRQIKAYGSTDQLMNKAVTYELGTEAKLIQHNHLSPHVRVKKSPLISHFSKVAPTNLAKTALVPVPPPISVHTPAFPDNKSLVNKPTQTHMSRTMEDIIERALAQATSHELPPHKLSNKKRRRFAITWMSSAVLILVIFLGVSQNLTNIKLQLASAKAGFTASLPRDLPSGYSLNQLYYSNGKVATLFHSNSSSQTYAIIQKTSSWDSQTLKDSYIAPAYPGFQVVASDGLTVYLYGNHNASWVSNGIWFTIQSNGTLSNHELVDMAGST